MDIKRQELVNVLKSSEERARLSGRPVEIFRRSALANLARHDRDKLLREADVEINKSMDAGNDVSLLRDYRKSLRDVPQQTGFPESIVWPVKPE